MERRAAKGNAPLDYRVVLEPDDNDTVLVSFPDFPEAHTYGDSNEEALARAQDALATVIDAYIRGRRPVPKPSKGKGPTVPVPALTVAKLELHEAMRRAHVNKSELARRLDVHLPQVDRLLDVYHGSRLDQLERAAEALGRRLVVSLRPATLPSARRRPASARNQAPRRTRRRRRTARRAR